MAGCLSCFTKCSLVKGTCPEYPRIHPNKQVEKELNDLILNCSIYQRRKKDPNFYFGAGYHNISLFRYEIRNALFTFEETQGKISKENLEHDIDLLLYLKFDKDHVTHCRDKIPEFEMRLFIQWIKKITKKKPVELLKGKKLDPDMVELYFGKEYLSKLTSKS